MIYPNASISDAYSNATAPKTPDVPVFLVQETDALVADDIIGSLRAKGQCRTIYARHPEDIAAALVGEPHLTAAILEIPFASVLAMQLDQALIALGARIILTAGANDEPDVRAAGWGMLVRPFTEQMIHDELAAPVVAVDAGA